jgi:hypothetical protein
MSQDVPGPKRNVRNKKRNVRNRKGDGLTSVLRKFARSYTKNRWRTWGLGRKQSRTPFPSTELLPHQEPTDSPQ